MIVLTELDGTRVAIHVDPGRPNAWLQEPYYSEIKEWSRLAAMQMHQVVVGVGKRYTVVLPDRDVDLGIVDDDERIITAERVTPFGVKLDALKLKADDPRIAGLPVSKPLKPPQ